MSREADLKLYFKSSMMCKTVTYIQVKRLYFFFLHVCSCCIAFVSYMFVNVFDIHHVHQLSPFFTIISSLFFIIHSICYCLDFVESSCVLLICLSASLGYTLTLRSIQWSGSSKLLISACIWQPHHNEGMNPVQN